MSYVDVFVPTFVCVCLSSRQKRFSPTGVRFTPAIWELGAISTLAVSYWGLSARNGMGTAPGNGWAAIGLEFSF